MLTKTNFVVSVRSFDLLALLGGPAHLGAFIRKISNTRRRDLG